MSGSIWCDQCVDYTNDLKETAGAGEEVEEDDEWEILKELNENKLYENRWMEINLTLSLPLFYSF